MSHAVRAVGALAAMVLLTLVGGCLPELKSDHPPERIYWLDVPVVPDPSPVSLNVTLVPGLDSDRIWVLEPDQRLNYYAGAFWPARLSSLLESLLSRALSASADGPEVRVLIERFFAVGDPSAGAPDVVRSARLQRAGARCVFETRRTASSDRLRDIVAAHQAVLDDLARHTAEVAAGGCRP